LADNPAGASVATWIFKQIPGVFLINTHSFRDCVPAGEFLRIADFNLRYTAPILNYGA
jgi:hypothetical protein